MNWLDFGGQDNTSLDDWQEKTLHFWRVFGLPRTTSDYHLAERGGFEPP